MRCCSTNLAVVLPQSQIAICVKYTGDSDMFRAVANRILVFFFVHNLQSPLKIVPFHSKLIEKKRRFSMTSLLLVLATPSVYLPSTDVALFSQMQGANSKFHRLLSLLTLVAIGTAVRAYLLWYKACIGFHIQSFDALNSGLSFSEFTALKLSLKPL